MSENKCKHCKGSMDAAHDGNMKVTSNAVITYPDGRRGSDVYGAYHECPACGAKNYTRFNRLD